ncbi:GNAT family N-acetyltransferase [Serratia liquefaciens]|jgi:L-amino acid N-acyltransferase YncA|uniref:GNAT family N-acetyltransferase n=1 Tax=Serratia liquefaciens TaxID=614 RepID=UPI00035866F4|nr:GNAT family N-acetyltransferase [Serratia liquefaciens]AGQ31932.1 N-acetyltransferase [Serratia liquefaciens ATCC 27592]MBF8105847.1 N-acetyltransferase [Serratia liquefaciens]QHT51825.1 N-acetyltransferase [Serratia liquefaciens]RYM85219.1 GNAT family N-acetyltransferase [Serratia liquefaciens]CAB1219592.1 L-amino acid N-acyltransferase MnaT [Serratia liquefaciens]
MLIRNATITDSAGIAAIYNDAVLNTTAIWNELSVDEANRAAWITERQGMGYPVLVAIDAAGEVMGYASFGDWRAWDGYRHTVEHSVYVRRDSRGGGVGKTLLIALIEQARAIGKHVMVAGIESGNHASVQLHINLGFEMVGRMSEVGAKFGKWLDLTFLQLKLDEASAPPKR